MKKHVTKLEKTIINRFKLFLEDGHPLQSAKYPSQFLLIL